MGYFFTFLFITTAYITPVVIFGPLAPFHVEIILAILAILASLPSLGSAGLARLPQTYAVLAIYCAIVASIAAGGWLGGIPQISYGFLSVAAGFFLTAVNCRKKWHFQLIVLSLFLVSVYFLIHGAIDLHNDVAVSPFLYGAETGVRRLRGLGYVNDPNDFAQVMVSLIPLIFLFRTKNRFANIFLVGIPIAVLITGMYFTHSRGSSIALMVVVLLSLRRKIGTVPAAVLAGLLMVAVLGAGWGGGRDINIDSGEGRLDAWSAGLQFVKSHPLLGVGYEQFGDLYGLTAHNSVIICVAEIGLPGFFCWVFFLFVSFRFSVQLGNTQPEDRSLGAASTETGDLGYGNSAPTALDLWASRRIAAVPVALQVVGPQIRAHHPSLFQSNAAVSPASGRWNSISRVAPDSATLPAEELRRIAHLLVFSLAGFLTAGWFLSRAFSIWLFMYCGMACAVLQMAERSGICIARDPLSHLVRWSAAVAFILLLAVYVLLRLHNIVG